MVCYKYRCTLIVLVQIQTAHICEAVYNHSFQAHQLVLIHRLIENKKLSDYRE